MVIQLKKQIVTYCEREKFIFVLEVNNSS